MGKHLPFGFRKRGQAPGDTGRDVTDEFTAAAAPLTVSALVGRIKQSLTDAFPRNLAVVGQISNFKRHGSGHLYFSLKDAAATIDCVMFRAAAAGVRFEPADGLEVVAEGRVDIYERQGRLQLYVQRLTPKGAGALELAFRQLKEKLAGEGLFDPARKKPVPRYPRAIGVVTSPTGAAIRDIARTLGRRWPAATAYLVGVRVQGDTAAGEIAEAVAMLDRAAGRLEIDTVIVARGGGSLEDLWAFNTEPVARAIAAAGTPVISGVGHETDFTIADFVADLRAATPTAAAEAATPDGAALSRHVAMLAGRLDRRVGELLAAGRAELRGVVRSVVFRDPSWRVRSARQTIDEIAGRARAAVDRLSRRGEQRLAAAEKALAAHEPRRVRERAGARLERARRDLAWALGRRARLAADALAEHGGALRAAHPRHGAALARHRVDALARQLEALSYKDALRRGFSVTRFRGGAILRSVADAGPGDWLATELHDGKIDSQVPGIRPRKKDDPNTPTLFQTE